ncbi:MULTISPECIES: metalloregulator ArsR/SmtB family transcription factor [unclassified Bradyrhizobium]|uniref:ArsR/SmtB family transcription factor n=1 Tax=unclassified Bradyrhizobium TaxID=2631580 RepID=UPI002478807C|nr:MULTISPECIES: metalloregulator ArsR/SmtB family transcription factor [unclassified Bradyrhizobium]WGS19725.1 metalloregulator ArsR/SmtB family transcription factor [Bradyrhizobium sp. ISRA463]WGS26570.1 metalloregulator ArsR/SmtB family transcription factor [Bradyrhizobium sp. ISRA464]
MAERRPKLLAFEQFALLARALGSEHRLELLDILIQGERSVERLAQAAHLTINNTSQHLQQLRRAGLVTSRKSGTQVIYSLTDPEVITLIRTLRQVAERNIAEISQVIARYYRDRDSLEPVSRDELRARLRKRAVVVLDVRPAEEYAAGHLPGAVSIPVSELKQRLNEVPKGQDVVACCRGPYCVYSYDAIEILRPLGFRVRRLDGGFSEWLAAGLPIERRAASKH